MSTLHNKRDSQWEELFAKRSNHITPGLTRVKAALACLPWGQKLPPAVVIGGTNGKGSTSGFLWHLLAGQQLRVGLFSSPHLCSFAERIQCSHRDIDEQYLLQEFKLLQQSLPAGLYEELSFFEINTLLALQIFTRENCQLMVLEVGLGGRWDATNCLEPLAVAITSIDMDHEQWLGNSFAAIAREKLGITRAQRPLFWGERFTNEKPGLADALRQANEEVPFLTFSRGQHFFLQGNSVAISLPSLPPQTVTLPDFFADFPTLLRENFSLSLALFYWLLNQPNLLGHRAPLDPEQIGEKLRESLACCGSEHIPWPPSLIGRLQHLRLSYPPNAPELVCDVGHNPAGIKEFIQYLQAKVLPGSPSGKIPLLFSCLQDKDCASMLNLLRPYCEPILLFQIDNARTFSRQSLPAQFANLPLFADFSKAWHYAIKNWQCATPSIWAICGSVAAIGEVLHFFHAFPHKRSYQKTLMGFARDITDS